MSIEQTFKKLLPSVVSLILCLGVATGMNFYTHHNIIHETYDKEVFQKADGILNHTELEINENGPIEIGKYKFFKITRFYTDNNGDEKVDKITQVSLFRDTRIKTFYRDEHLEHYPQVFEMADQDFRKQMKRFKPLMNR